MGQDKGLDREQGREQNKEQPQIHLYHGTGKGKTTAAVGLAIRMAGAGKKVLFVQLMKGNDSSEMKLLRQLPQMKVLQVGRQFGFSWNMTEQEKTEITARHNEMLRQAAEIITASQAGPEEERIALLVLDEAVSAWRLRFLDRTLLQQLLTKKPCEIVLTGRDPDDELTGAADYITNMQMERHPYEKGLQAREGIEW